MRGRMEEEEGWRRKGKKGGGRGKKREGKE